MASRELPPSSPFAGDDGSAPAAVASALELFGRGAARVVDVVTALVGTRVLVPVLASLDSAETLLVAGTSHTVEKEASAGIVALRAPDGRTALPVFSSVAAMAAWRSDARPVPSDIARAALSAVTEGWELMVLDPGGPVTVLVPRPAVWALAQQQTWEPAVVEGPDGPVVAADVRAAVRRAVLAGVGAAGSADTDPAGGGPVLGVDAVPGRRAEVAVALTLTPGLDRAALDDLLRRAGEALAADEVATARIDSLEMRVLSGD